MHGHIKTPVIFLLNIITKIFMLGIKYFSMCDFSRRGTILETCPYMTISAFQWYPTQINGHKFRGRNADFLQLPDTMLAVPALLTADCGNLSQIQLTEFRTEHWFLSNDTTTALNGKVGKFI